MNNEEIQSLIKQLKAQGLEDEQIMDVFYKTFTKGEMDRNDLETLANAMGYELTDEFKNDKTPDPITEGGEKTDGEITKEEAEAAKALEPGETAEEFKDKIEDMKDGEEPEEKSEEETEEESTVDEDEETSEEETEDDEKDWEKAQKMFRI